MSSKSRVGTGVGTLDEAFVALYARQETGWLVCDTLPAHWDELTHFAIDPMKQLRLPSTKIDFGRQKSISIEKKSTIIN